MHFKVAVPCIQTNDSQSFAPSLRSFHLLKEVSKILTLPFSFLKLDRHHARYHIVAMFQDLSRQCDGDWRHAPGDEPYAWSVVWWEVRGSRPWRLGRRRRTARHNDFKVIGSCIASSMDTYIRFRCFGVACIHVLLAAHNCLSPKLLA
jgi:hypothetical protein